MSECHITSTSISDLQYLTCMFSKHSGSFFVPIVEVISLSLSKLLTKDIVLSFHFLNISLELILKSGDASNLGLN